MIKFFSIGTAALLLLTLAAPVEARMSVAQAEEKCLKRMTNHAMRPYGRRGGAPAPTQIKDMYRACVYAYAKAYPTRNIWVRGARVRFAE